MKIGVAPKPKKFTIVKIEGRIQMVPKVININFKLKFLLRYMKKIEARRCRPRKAKE
jgi:hypothetical protein